MTKKDVAIAEVLIYEMKKPNNKVKNKTNKIVKLISDLSILGTESGQFVQALSMLSKLEPVQRMMHLKRILDRLERQYQNTKPFKFNIDEKLFEEMAKAKTLEEAIIVENKIIKEAINQVPSRTLDKLNAWRYLSMLLNPTTHLRNIIGNIIMTPLIASKNFIGANIEMFIPEDQRTKSIIVDKKYIEFARNDYESVSGAISGSGKYDSKTEIERNKKIFNTRALEYLRKTNSNLLDLEDTFFSKFHYVNALSGYLNARKIDIETISQEDLEKARKYSILEAQKAVFRDFNGFANLLNHASNQNMLYYFAIQGTVPFTKTPFNIAKRGMEYNPIGIIYQLIKSISDHQKGYYDTNKFIDSISAGLSGTIVVALGMLLASLGLLSTGKDDESDKEASFMKMLGNQQFSLVLPHGTYTIDWAVPATLPLFVGANMFKELSREAEGSMANVIPEALLNTLDPLFELTAFSGLSRTIQSFSGNTIQFISETMKTTAQNYVLQLLPTIFSKIAKIIDPISRSTYASKESEINPFVEETLRKMINKIPFLTEYNEPYVDQFGREVTNSDFNSVLGKFFAQFASVGYYNSTINTKEEDLILKLFTSSLNQDVLPKLTPSYITYNGEKYIMKANELSSFAKTLGTNSKQLVDTLFTSNYFTNLPEESKIELISNMYDYSYSKAKEQLLNSRGKMYDDKEYKKVKNGIQYGVTPTTYYISKLLYGKIESDGVSKEKPFIDALKSIGMNSSQIEYILPAIGGYKLSESDMNYIQKGE